jgi:hypothetical protein
MNLALFSGDERNLIFLTSDAQFFLARQGTIFLTNLIFREQVIEWRKRIIVATVVHEIASVSLIIGLPVERRPFQGHPALRGLAKSQRRAGT